jgi:U4/U6 small nuclear ribonucleoprotein PRP31
MSKLADEFLADLQDDESDDEGLNDFDDERDVSAFGHDANGATDIDEHPITETEITNAASAGKSITTDAMDQDEAKAKVEKIFFHNLRDIRTVAGLMKQLKPVLEQIENFKNHPTDNTGTVTENPEYKLMTQSNQLSIQIDNEIVLVHKFLRDHYSARFPELETLVVNPIHYARTVAIIGNGPFDQLERITNSTDNLVGKTLKEVIDGPSVMTVRLEAATTKGQALDNKELDTVMQACEMMFDLHRAKGILTDYVQSRMSLFAPNLTALIGSEVAAQLVNTAGGIAALANIPSCNLASVGNNKQRQGASNLYQREGYIYFSPILRNVPAQYKKQALRIITAKVTLAARIDTSHAYVDGSQGESMKQQCLDKIEKLTEPPPNRGKRALPVPDDKPSRKRGGRRARKAKEAVASTELNRARNRMAFGKEEREVGIGIGDETVGLGMMGSEDDGRIRDIQIDKRTAAKLSKKNPGWGGTGTAVGGTASSIAGAGVGGATQLGIRSMGVNPGAGTASTVAFTAREGLSLADPKRVAQGDKVETSRWFDSGTFSQVGAGTAGAGKRKADEAKLDNEGFKVPAIPALKRVKKN